MPKFLNRNLDSPKALIVNCFSDKYRDSKGSPRFMPQSIATFYLAGAFHLQKTEVRTYCEYFSGPFESFAALQWANLLVLTGLNASFDRMMQITAYTRTLNPKIVVTVGGPLARVLPKLCTKYFDYICQGDVVELVDVIVD